MSYEIIITRTVNKVKLVGKEWDKIKGDEFGYTPQIQKEVVVEEEVYKQVVDDLDLVGVIAAVNAPMPGPIKIIPKGDI